MLTFFLVNYALLAQVKSNFDWGWESQKINENGFYQEEILKQDQKNSNILTKTIYDFKRKESGMQGKRCPAFPSCSTFSLYSLKKYGLLQGLLMTVDRIYLHETKDLSKYHQVELTTNNRRYEFYDIPEANNIFTSKDWRYVDPDFYPWLKGNRE